MTPLPGDFACRNMGGEGGKLITIGEWLDGDGFSIYDHAEIYVGMADSHTPWGYSMGAYPGGARLSPIQLESQLGDGDGWLWSTGKVWLTTDQRQAVVRNALACQGIPYSWLDYFAIAAHRLRIPVPGLKAYIGDTRHMICSVLVDHVYLMAGIHLFQDGRWPGYVTPADLANLILDSNA